jgi:biotin carboxylase
MKNIVVLTGSYWQKELLAAIRELGLRSILLDRDENCYCKPLCDEFIQVDCSNSDACIEALSKTTIDGILAEQTDVAVITASRIASYYNIIFIEPSVADRLTDKTLMRNHCKTNNFKTPAYCVARNSDEAISAAASIGFPVILKPTDAQSSKGVSKVFNKLAIKPAFEYALAHTGHKKVLVEELLLGIEASVESYVSNGKVHVLGVSQKEKSPPPYSFDTKLIYPPNFPEQSLKDIKRLNEKIIRSFGVDIGFVHAEYIITPSGIYLLEIAGRGCGSGVTTKLLPLMCGTDLVKVRVLDAIDSMLDSYPLISNFEPKDAGKTAILYFIEYAPGKVKSINNIDLCSNIPNVVDVRLNIKVGDYILKPTNGAERHGSIHICANSYVEAEASLSLALNTLEVEVS